MERAAAILGAALLLAACESSAPLVIGRPGTGAGELDRPRGVAAAAGRVAVVDMTGRLQRFTADGKLETSFDVMPKGARRGFPLGLLLEADGGAAVVHTHESAIVRYGPDGKETSRFGSNGIAEGEFCMPQRAVRDGDTILVSEFGYPECRRVQRFGAGGKFLRRIGGPGTSTEFARPMGIAVDADGVVWVADTSHRLFRLGRDGKALGTVGSEGSGVGLLNMPTGVAALPGGGVLVCEAGNHRLQRFGPRGEPLGVFGRGGTAPGEFAGPYDLAVDPPYVFVADTDNHRVQRFRLDAIPWTGGGAR